MLELESLDWRELSHAYGAATDTPQLLKRIYAGPTDDVFPVVGWWRERYQFGRWERKARYALVVSISTPRIETDIYTPVATQIQIPIEITNQGTM